MEKKQINVEDVVIEDLSIHSSFGKWDLVPHLEELNIYENLFENHMSAHLTLSETYNLPSNLPIFGEETVTCRIRLTGDNDKLIISPPIFHVHELSDRYLRTPQSQRFSLDLVSEQYMSNIHARVNKSYIGWHPDDIVSDIWHNYLDDGHGELNSEIAKPIDCIIPGWTPHQAFNWLCQRSQPEDNERAANFVYFETMDTTHFVSLDTLVQDYPVVIFSADARFQDPAQVMALGGRGETLQSNRPWAKVDTLTYMGSFQKVKNINKGQYSSKLITHDIVKKKILQHDYDGFEDWSWLNHVGLWEPISNSITELQTGNTARTSYAPPRDGVIAVTEGKTLSDFTDSRVEFYPKHDRMYAQNEKDLHDNKVEEWKQRRQGQMVSFDGIQMMVKCAGVSGLRVGMVVDLVVPSPQKTSHGTHGEAYDKYLTGEYLVTHIKHTFASAKNKTIYKMSVILTKDAVDNIVTNRMPLKSGNDIQ